MIVMKKIILIALLIISSMCHGRLLENYEQCVERYGKPIKKDDHFFGSLKGDPNKRECTYTFVKNKYEIDIRFFNNKAYEIVYRTKPFMTNDEVLAVLNIYSNNWNVTYSNISEYGYGSTVGYKSSDGSWYASNSILKDIGEKAIPSTYLVVTDRKIQEQLIIRQGENNMKKANKSINGL
jgi:hypothetical protein